MSPTAKFCIQCGAQFSGGERFCVNCGHQRAGAPTEVKGPATPFQRGISGGVDLRSRPFLLVATAQIVAIIFWHVLRIFEFGIEVDSALKFGLPSTILMLAFAAPLLFVGFAERWTQNTVALSASAIAGLIQFSRNARMIFEDVREFEVGWLVHHLLVSSAIVATALAVISILHRGSLIAVVGPTHDWWRIPFGAVAGALLMFEYPGRVLLDYWRLLSLLVVALIIAGAFAKSAIRIGLFGGLGFVVLGTILGNAMRWILDPYWRDYFSLISLPSLGALICCVVIVVPDLIDERQRRIAFET